jgi:HEAT repeat protein
MLSLALLVLLLPPPQAAAAETRGTMHADVDRLVRAAEQLTGTWPTQPPPPIPEVTLVARHGRAVVPSLIALLADDPQVTRDRSRWQVQQQVALTLSRIYDESAHCGRAYCDGDPPERIARVKAGWLRLIADDAELRSLSPRHLLDRFKAERVTWRQFEIGEALAESGDHAAVGELDAWLAHDHRRVRGNVAFVLGRLGDPRGFRAIVAMLADRAPRPMPPEEHHAEWTVESQIRSDRYYAAHLLGDLKDPRAVDVLIPLLNDRDVRYIVPWSLAQIGDRRAIRPLIAQLERDDPSTRVLAILALETLNARQALPRLRALRQDGRRSSFGDLTSVATAAERAIAVISSAPRRPGQSR